jgi:hypothetical protein
MCKVAEIVHVLPKRKVVGIHISGALRVEIPVIDVTAIEVIAIM